MATAKMQTGGLKTSVHKKMGNVRTAMPIIYTVYATAAAASHKHSTRGNCSFFLLVKISILIFTDAPC